MCLSVVVPWIYEYELGFSSAVQDFDRVLCPGWNLVDVNLFAHHNSCGFQVPAFLHADGIIAIVEVVVTTNAHLQLINILHGWHVSLQRAG